MGITKRPTNFTDEIIPVEIIEFDEISSASDSDEENYDLYIPPFHIINSVAYYRSIFPELIVNTHNEVHSVINNDNTVTFKKKNVSHIGRKKANRIQNENFLLSLINDQYSSEDEIFLNDNKNGFTKSIKKMCTRPDLQELFIEGNDDLVLQKGKKYYSNTENNKKKKRSVCPELAFKNLTTSQKSLFKQKSLPISAHFWEVIINQYLFVVLKAAIDYLETEIVGFFSRLPNGVYMSSPLQNYNRILLHSIVRYYSLDATSLNSRGHRSQKIVQVRNDRFNDFQPPRMSLLKFALSITAEKLNKTFSGDT